MSKVEVESHVDEALAQLKRVRDNALEIIAQKAENYAADNLTHPRELAPELRNSLIHTVKDGTMIVGSNMLVAPYIELGTGPLYEPPPEWLENNAQPGRGQAGIKSWIYYDLMEKKFKIGTPQKARPFLRPAIADHLDEYREIIKQELAENGMTTVKG